MKITPMHPGFSDPAISPRREFRSSNNTSMSIQRTSHAHSCMDTGVVSHSQGTQSGTESLPPLFRATAERGEAEAGSEVWQCCVVTLAPTTLASRGINHAVQTHTPASLRIRMYAGSQTRRCLAPPCLLDAKCCAMRNAFIIGPSAIDENSTTVAFELLRYRLSSHNLPASQQLETAPAHHHVVDKGHQALACPGGC